jgi:hypothetical protein
LGLQNCPYNEARLTVSGRHQTGLRWTIVTRASGLPTPHPRLASRSIRLAGRGPRTCALRVAVVCSCAEVVGQLAQVVDHDCAVELVELGLADTVHPLALGDEDVAVR